MKWKEKEIKIKKKKLKKNKDSTARTFTSSRIPLPIHKRQPFCDWLNWIVCSIIIYSQNRYKFQAAITTEFVLVSESLRFSFQFPFFIYFYVVSFLLIQTVDVLLTSQFGALLFIHILHTESWTPKAW